MKNKRIIFLLVGILLTGCTTRNDLSSSQRGDNSIISSTNESSSTTNINTYTITWENWDGTILEIDNNVKYGDMPSYDGSVPTKEATAQYSYTFAGWTPEISSVTKDKTYTAIFNCITNSYKVTWKNWDGTILEIDENVSYGTMPTYNGNLPSKESSTQYTYEFSGWYPAIETVKSDVEYVACFNGNLSLYTVTWKNWDDTILEIDENVPYGTMPTYNGITPKKISNAQYNYEFSGWSPKIEQVTDNATYIAQYSNSINYYTVTWKNWDGTILEVDEKVPYGTMPTYDGITPKKISNAQYNYEFLGWSPEVNQVTGNATYIAQYSNLLNCYTITWKNWDGTILEVDENVPYGTIPTYDSVLPTKKKSAQYSYSFEGWSPNISSVIGDITYTANFSQTINRYVVEFKNYDSSILYSTSVNYGENATFVGSVPLRPDEGHKHYVFKGWSESIENIKSDTSVIAEYTVYDVYKFIFADGTNTTIQVPENSDIRESFPKNSEMFSTINSETSYSWVADGEYQYKEVGLTKNFFYVTYDLNGGVNNSNNPIKVYSDESYSLFAASKKGYTFKGWYSEKDFINEISVIKDFESDINLYAKFEPVFYSITYHLNGGTNAAKNPDVYTIEDTITLKDATKKGYDFKGWYKDELMTEPISSISSCIDNIDLYAKFIPLSYTCTFKDGITLTLKASGFKDRFIYMSYNDVIDPYSSEIMSYYLPLSKNSHFASDDPNFSGWYYDSSYNNKVTESIVLTSNTTIYCHFNRICYYSDAKSMLKDNKSQSYYDDEAYGFYRVPTLSDGKVNIKIYFVAMEGNTYYGNTLYIYNYSNSKSLLIKNFPSKNKQYSYNLEYNFEVDPGDVVYCSLVGWSTSTRVTYTINNRMTASLTSKRESVKNVLYDDVIANQEHNEKRGYDFAGWADSKGNLVSGTNWNYLENQIFTPSYTIKNYTINYHLDGGTNSPNNPSTYTVEDSIKLSVPYKEGYTFVGWHLGNKFGQIVSDITDSVGTIDLYAEFSINSYSLVLNGNEGHFSPKITFKSNGETIRTEYLHDMESIQNFYPDNRPGYMFVGWYTDSNFKKPFNFNGTIYDDITLYAKWVEYDGALVRPEKDDTCDVQINGKNESLVAFTPIVSGNLSITSLSDLDLVGALLDEYKNELISSDDISDENLNFSYSYFVEAGKTYYISVKGNTVSNIGNATLEISFDGIATINGSTSSSREFSIVYGESFYLPDNVEREGYIFIGWYDDNGTQYTSGEWYYTESLTLHAVWKEI